MRRTQVILGLIMASSLISCSGSEEAVTTGQGSTTETPTATSSDSPPTEPSKPPSVARFNERFAYGDGLKIRIVEATSDTLERTGCCARAGSPIAIFTLELDNRSPEVFDPAFFSATLTYGKADRNAEQVFDPEQQIITS